MLVPVTEQEKRTFVQRASNFKDALFSAAGRVLGTLNEGIHHGIEMSAQAIDTFKDTLISAVSVFFGSRSAIENTA